MQRVKMLILGIRGHDNIPLANGLPVNAKAAVCTDRDILGTIETALAERCQEGLAGAGGVWDSRKKQ